MSEPYKIYASEQYVDEKITEALQGNSDSIKYTAQTLTDDQKSQARTNIGAEALGSADAALTSANAYTDEKVAGIVNSSPETLDTLNELAAALGNDENFATTVATQIGSKVDKVDGKGLSTEDYTTEEKEKLAGISTKLSGFENDVGFLTSIPNEYVTDDELTAKGYLTSYTETDPTVPDWAKQPTKPTYTADEVGALPDTTVIPTNISELTNDSGYLTSIPAEYITETELEAKGYLTSYTETDPTVPEWAKAATKPTYTASEVGALPDDTVIPTKTSDLTNDSGFLASIPSEYITETELFSYGYLTSYTETDPTVPEWAKQPAKPTYTASEVGALPDTTTIPTKTSELTNDSGFLTSIPSEYITETELNAKGYLTSYTETDPTVPEWAKADTKPTYTASEVGALPDTTTIPTKTSDLTNDSGYLTVIPSEYITETELAAYGYLTSYTETDPTVPAWAKEANKPTYTAAEVGALPADTVIPSIDGLATESYVDTAVATKITAPTTATVGQILSVKSVDTNGAPTEWEAVDYNSVTENRVNELITAALSTTQSYYTGTADPEDSLGSDGDIYLKTT